MQFEQTQLRSRPDRRHAPSLVWDGFVRGHPESWVVVAPGESDLAEWLVCEAVAVEHTPLRICRAILDDDVLVLAETEIEEGELFQELY